MPKHVLNMMAIEGVLNEKMADSWVTVNPVDKNQLYVFFESQTTGSVLKLTELYKEVLHRNSKYPALREHYPWLDYNEAPQQPVLFE
ncbi:hypothetical protein RN22_03595 [Grimontia sp. AD028]|nr:hypothetical protein RN22_03595 [Grimontia sp. AD028]